MPKVKAPEVDSPIAPLQMEETAAPRAEHCMVCGERLNYSDRAQELKCIYCSRVEPEHISCPKGHYVCDLCHNQDSMRLVKNIVFTNESVDPFEIAERAMGISGLPMLGCQHAYIAGGALMAAVKNEGSRGVRMEDLNEVFHRTEKQAHGGYCGLTGVCGIAPAVGACVSVMTGSKCGKDEEQRITMEAVSRVSRAITDLTGPSCCKAYVRVSLETAVDFLKERLGVELPRMTETLTCRHSDKHPHGCRETSCPYFNGNGTPVRAPSAAEKGIRRAQEGPMRFSSAATMEGRMEHLVNKALELGAEKAKIIETNTVVLEEWVRWKCQYGCALYEKDAFHPPCAPDAESAKKVIKEYSKAILMNGPKGKLLTDAAVKLEGEAYHMGYYKAFALTALSSGPPGNT